MDLLRFVPEVVFLVKKIVIFAKIRSIIMECMTKLTGSLEDYLEAAYLIEKNKGEVRITDIALFMNLSKPSVNKAVSNLKDNGLLEHEKYGLIKLTEPGTKLAKEIYFRHETLTKFFIGTLGIKPEVAEEEACKIEHIISHQTLSKLVDYMQKKNFIDKS